MLATWSPCSLPNNATDLSSLKKISGIKDTTQLIVIDATRQQVMNGNLRISMHAGHV